MLILASLAGGCRSNASVKAIPDSTMVDLLVELHLANGRIEVTDRPLDFPRDSIFQVYGIDSTAYARMIGYYARHPEEYSEIYGRVLDELSEERAPEQLADSTRARPPDTTRVGRRAPID